VTRVWDVFLNEGGNDDDDNGSSDDYNKIVV